MNALGYNHLITYCFTANSTTIPPALGFANSVVQSQAQSTADATVYPLVMILRIMTAQLFIILC